MTSCSAVRVFATVLAFVLTASACAPQTQPLAPVTPSSSAVATPSTALPQASPSAAAAPASLPQEVRYGDLKLLADPGVYIAMEEGYFAEQGIDLELVTFDSAANMVAPLATNQLEAVVAPPARGYTTRYAMVSMYGSWLIKATTIRPRRGSPWRTM